MTTVVDPAWHALDAAQVMSQLQTRPEGLSWGEVRQRLRQQRYDPPVASRLQTQLTRSLSRLAASILCPSVVLLLVLGGGALAAQHGSEGDLFLGFAGVQALRRVGLTYWLWQLLATNPVPITPQARVLRDQQVQQVPASELVRGDIVLLAEGDCPVADLRLLAANDLHVCDPGQTEPSLRQSEPLPLRVAQTEQTNLVHSGGSVHSGRGLGVVIQPSMQTPSFTQSRTARPLRNLPQLSRLAAGGLYSGLVLVILLGLLGRGELSEMAGLLGVLAALILPDEFALAALLALSLRARRLEHLGLRLRTLPDLERLSQTTSCGTTLLPPHYPELYLTELYLPDRSLGSESVLQAQQDSQLHQFLLVAVLSSELGSPDSPWAAEGEAIAAALAEAALRAGIPIARLHQQFPCLAATPFDPNNPRITLHGSGLLLESTERPTPEVEPMGSRFACLQGPVEPVLSLCQFYWQAGEARPLGKTACAYVQKIAERMGRWGLRVVAVATAPSGEALDPTTWSEGAIFLGLAGLECPVQITQQELSRAYDASPLRLVFLGEEAPAAVAAVTTLQKQGERVAVLGSEAQDLAVLRQADLGLALVSDGSDVTRAAAAVLLADAGDLTLLPQAVRQARAAVAAAWAVIFKLLSGQLGLLLLVGGFSGVNSWPLPLLPNQLVLLVLLSLGSLDLTLAAEPGRPERQQLSRAHRLSWDFSLGILVVALNLALVGSVVFLLSYADNLDRLNHARTLTLLTLLCFQGFSVLASRDQRRSVLQLSLLANPALALGLLTLGLLCPALVYLQPLRSWFTTVPLSTSDWLTAAILGSTALWVRELFKVLVYR